MKMMNIAKKYGKKIVVAVPFVALGALPVTANAALADGVKTAITNGFSDAQEGAALILVGLAALFGIRLVMRLFGR